MGCCADCKCQGIPRVTIWTTDSPGVSIGDHYLRRRASHAQEYELWGTGALVLAADCRLFDQINETTLVDWLVESDSLFLSTVDAAGHILTRHEFEPLRSVDESGDPETFLALDVELVQGSNSDEYVVTFSGWNAALPLELSISSDLSDSSSSGVPETLAQTSALVWTFSRATDTAPGTTRTTLSVGLREITFSESDTLETVSTLFENATAGVDVLDGSGCSALRRELFHYVRSFGTNTDLDPAPLYVQLDMTEKRAEPIHRQEHNAIRPKLQVIPLEGDGLYPAENGRFLIGNYDQSPSAVSAVWTFDVRIADLPIGDPLRTPLNIDITVRLCDGGWSLEFERGSGGIYDLFVPKTTGTRHTVADVTPTDPADLPAGQSFAVSVDISATLVPNRLFQIQDSTDRDGTYTAASVTWDAGAGKTTIETVEEIPVVLDDTDAPVVDGVLLASPELRGDRPGKMVFEWSRRIIKSVPDADGSEPDPAAGLNPGWDLSAAEIEVYVLGEHDSIGGSHYHHHPDQATGSGNGDPPERALHIDSSGWTGQNAGKLNGTFERLRDFQSVIWPEPSTSLSVWSIGLDTGDETNPATFELVVFSGSVAEIEDTPRTINYHRRRIELHVTTGLSTNAANPPELAVFEPADGERVHFDRFFDAEIEWTLKSGDSGISTAAAAADITTKLTYTIPGDCLDYQNHDHDSPLVFQMKYAGETYFLPTVEPSRWSRIIEVDGVNLAFCLERYGPSYLHGENSAAWQLTIYDADDIELPWQQVYRFIHAGPQHEAELEESPPFIDWKPYDTNQLSLVWRRSFQGDEPRSVELLALPVSHPAGTAAYTWSEADREWSISSDNRNTEINLPLRQPTTRAAVDGAERSIVAGYYATGSSWTYWSGWWSPDGISWELIVDGTAAVTLERPPAPTHTPAGPGDSYRAAGVTPPPPTPTGDCIWHWDATLTDWVNDTDDCGVGKQCDKPTGSGSSDGEVRAGSCSIVDCGSKKARYLWLGGIAPADWILLDHECPSHCSPPGGPSTSGFVGEIVFVDCVCTGPGCP